MAQNKSLTAKGSKAEPAAKTRSPESDYIDDIIASLQRRAYHEVSLGPHVPDLSSDVRFAINLFTYDLLDTGLKGAEALALTRMMLAIYAYEAEGLLLTKSDAMHAIGAEHLATARSYADIAQNLGFITIETASTDRRMQLLVPTTKGIDRVKQMLKQIRDGADWLITSKNTTSPLAAPILPVGHLTIISDPTPIKAQTSGSAKSPPPRTIARYLAAYAETLHHIPAHIPALTETYQLYSWLNEFDRALPIAERLEKLEPGKHLFEIGYLHLQMGNYSDAITTLSANLEHSGKNYSTNLARAKAYLGSRQYKPALEDIETVAQIWKNNPLTDHLMVRGAALAGLRRFDEAIDVFENARHHALHSLNEYNQTTERIMNMVKRDPSLQGLLDTLVTTSPGADDSEFIETMISTLRSHRDTPAPHRRSKKNK